MNSQKKTAPVRLENIHWLKQSRAEIYRKFLHIHLCPSAKRVAENENFAAKILIQDLKLTIEENPDFDFMIARENEIHSPETLYAKTAPGGVCIIDLLNHRRLDPGKILNEFVDSGYTTLDIIYFGFFSRLFTFPFRIAGIYPDESLPPVFPVNLFLRKLMKIEIKLLPFIKFITGERLLYLFRKEEIPVPTKLNLSIIIPAFNEEKRIERYLNTIQTFLKNRQVSAEILVIDDGSSDKTADICRNIKNSFPELDCISLYRNFGKGGAIKEGVRLAKGKFILMSDADGSTPIHELDRLLEHLNKGKDIAIGSRYLPESHILKKQSLLKRFISRGGNLIIRLFTGMNYHDTQCGFKLFRNEPAKILFENLHNPCFGFDIEILQGAKRRGYSVVEAPVDWTDIAGSKTSAFASLHVLWELIQLQFGSVFRFSFVGILNTMIDYLIHNALILLYGRGTAVDQSIYQGVAFIGANIFSYLANSGFTFRAHGKYWKFFLISITAFTLSLLSYYSLSLSFNPSSNIFIANLLKLSTVVISFTTNYFGYKYLVYKK